MAFVTDLNKALEYEEKFCHWYNHNNTKNNKMTWLNQKFDADYLVTPSEDSLFGNDFKAEIKIDFTKYPNFFIETLSNIDTKRIGGPWQAHQYGASFFVYWFVGYNNPNRYNCYVFKLNKLLDWLSLYKDKYPVKQVKNKNYITEGIAVPVKELDTLSFVKSKRIEP